MATAAKEKLNLFQRLNNITAEIEAIPKLARNEHGKYDYVSHDQVTEALRPLFVKHGVQPMISVKEASFIPEIVREDGSIDSSRIMMTVTCTLVNIDDPEDVHVTEYTHLNPSMGGKESGAALSYCTKYAYSKLFLISGASAELDAENPTTSTRRKKKKGIVTDKQARYLWAEAKNHEVEAPIVRLKIMLSGFDKAENLPVKVFDEILDWVRSGGVLDGDEQVPESSVSFLADVSKKNKSKPLEGVENFTVAEWAQAYKAIISAEATV